MRLISPNNNRRELVLLSRLAQTMAIHANLRAERSWQSTSHAKVLVRHPPIFLPPPSAIPSSTYTFDSSASAVGVQWCQTIDPYFRRRVEAWTRIKAVEHQGDVSLVRSSLNLSLQTDNYIHDFCKIREMSIYYPLIIMMLIVSFNKIIFYGAIKIRSIYLIYL